MTEIDPELSRLYREAASEGPPAALDAAILAAARKQVAQPRRPARAAWMRWMAPASALATLVVAVSLAFLMEREQPGTPDDAAIRAIPPRPQSVPPASATEPVTAKAANGAASAGAAKMDTPAAASGAAAEAALRKEAPAQTPAPAPSSAVAFPAERRAKAAESKMAAPSAAAESNAARDAALGAAGAATSAAPAAAPTAPAAAAASKVAPQRQPAAQRSPEAWLAEIDRLKREGRDHEAAEQLAQFRKTYPAFAVPESLRGLQ